MDPRDHVYAFLGHPLARLEGDGGTVIKPDYAKEFRDVCLELVIQLLKQENPLRLLSTTEHDEQSLEQDSPSWVPDWNLGQTQLTLGISSNFYYNASAGLEVCSPVFRINKLEVRGVIIDAVLKASRFSDTELGGLDNPVKGGKSDF